MFQHIGPYLIMLIFYPVICYLAPPTTYAMGSPNTLRRREVRTPRVFLLVGLIFEKPLEIPKYCGRCALLRSIV